MADKKLIIADGHHRYETSVTYMHERALPNSASPLLNFVIPQRPFVVIPQLPFVVIPQRLAFLSSRSEAEGSAFPTDDAAGESPSNQSPTSLTPMLHETRPSPKPP